MECKFSAEYHHYHYSSIKVYVEITEKPLATVYECNIHLKRISIVFNTIVSHLAGEQECHFIHPQLYVSHLLSKTRSYIW